jgi:hypothetical protein
MRGCNIGVVCSYFDSAPTRKFSGAASPSEPEVIDDVGPAQRWRDGTRRYGNEQGMEIVNCSDFHDVEKRGNKGRQGRRGRAGPGSKKRPPVGKGLPVVSNVS